MNVLFISSWFPTKNNPNFGVFVKEHAKAIQTTEAQLVVLAVVTERSKSLFKISVSDYLDESGFRIVETLISTRFRDLVYHLVPLQNRIAYSISKRYIFSDFKPDIVHSNVVFPAGIIGDFISRKINKPHIITEHWSKIAGILQKPFLSGLVKKAYRNAAIILPVSEFLQNRMMKLLPELRTSNFQIIPNVIDSRLFTYKQKTPIADELRFCAIATWATKKVPDKKPELFIEALEAIQVRTNKKITLTMIGGGDRVEELRNLCADKSYKTQFLGYQTKEEIAEILQNSDFFIHASTMETFGVVVVEAMMTGTPVICSNVAALPELINETNGVLCENTTYGWVKGIEKALNSKFNSKAIADNVKNEYSLESVGAKIMSVYKELLDK
jgi:glycosyltransferase involved in cell wall biosynthesis